MTRREEFPSNPTKGVAMPHPLQTPSPYPVAPPDFLRPVVVAHGRVICQAIETIAEIPDEEVASAIATFYASFPLWAASSDLSQIEHWDGQIDSTAALVSQLGGRVPELWTRELRTQSALLARCHMQVDPTWAPSEEVYLPSRSLANSPSTQANSPRLPYATPNIDAATGVFRATRTPGAEPIAPNTTPIQPPMETGGGAGPELVRLSSLPKHQDLLRLIQHAEAVAKQYGKPRERALRVLGQVIRELGSNRLAALRESLEGRVNP
jgi:hypothetical protein